MPELRHHQPLPEVDVARLRPAVRSRPRVITNVRCIRCGNRATTSPCADCVSAEHERPAA